MSLIPETESYPVYLLAELYFDHNNWYKTQVQ